MSWVAIAEEPPGIAPSLSHVSVSIEVSWMLSSASSTCPPITTSLGIGVLDAPPCLAGAFPPP